MTTSVPQDFPSVVDLLRRKGVWLEKRKSQHFLRDQSICSEIADLCQLTKDSVALEVGAGLGNLTVELATRAGDVIAVEMDSEFSDWHDYLKARWPAAKFLASDFLRISIENVLAPYKDRPLCGVGNLPYQITSEVLFRFVDSPLTFDSLVFMIQKEVAERISAGAGTRACGALTYKIALRYECKIAMIVGPEHFLPPPKVTSAVVVLTPLKKPLYRDALHRSQIYRVLDRIFNFRRKTILNGLRESGLVEGREAAAAVLASVGIDEKRRPENLSLQDIVALADAISGTHE